MNTNICIVLIFCAVSLAHQCCDDNDNEVVVGERAWSLTPGQWSLGSRIAMSPDYDDEVARKKNPFKVKKKFQKFLVPLLLAYKLKFFTLIPVLIGGLILLTGATGLAGFFFALFAAVMGLKAGGGH